MCFDGFLFITFCPCFVGVISSHNSLKILLKYLWSILILVTFSIRFLYVWLWVFIFSFFLNFLLGVLFAWAESVSGEYHLKVIWIFHGRVHKDQYLCFLTSGQSVFPEGTPLFSKLVCKQWSLEHSHHCLGENSTFLENEVPSNCCWHDRLPIGWRSEERMRGPIS